MPERESTLDPVRSSLDGAARQRFEAGLGTCQHANFSWWQEEQYFYLDLRAYIPLRMASLRIGDPIMKEIFGVDQRLLSTVGSIGAEMTSLSGVPASSCVARDRARGMIEVTELGDLEPDEILVCVFTLPNWTLAFAQIAGCVCDTGGALLHSANVSREHRIPAVCATGVATKLIRTGDVVEVGTAGVVTIVERA